MSQTDHARDDAAPGAPDGPPAPVDDMRVTPSAALLPGTRDSRRLLVTWFVKKSFWWMVFGGSAVASIVHAVERVDDELEVRLSSPDSVMSGLLSAYSLVVLALLIRVIIGWVALALAYPLARAYEDHLDARTGWTRYWGTFSDRYKVAKAFRLLRWTHHVRQAALDRVAPGPSWWRRADPIIDIATVVAIIGFFATGIVLAVIEIT